MIGKNSWIRSFEPSTYITPKRCSVPIQTADDARQRIRRRLIVWCKGCRHRVEPDPAEMAARYSAETPVLDWRERLVCSRCGSRGVDLGVSRTKIR